VPKEYYTWKRVQGKTSTIYRLSATYEMDGDANGPVKTDVTLREDQDLLESSALGCVRRCIARSEGNVNFSLLALVNSTNDSQ